MATSAKRKPADTTAEERLEHIEAAIRRGGGILNVAKTLGVSHQAVSYWRKRMYVPIDRALAIEKLYGIPREMLVLPEVAAAYFTPRAVGSDIV